MFELILFDNGLEVAVDGMFRSGFYSTDEIVRFFSEIAEDDPDAGLNPETIEEDVRRILATAADELAIESANWPEKTDNDRLSEAFRRLNECGIRALENYGGTASDCGELYSEIRGDARWRGYCFYHGQDLTSAVLGGELMLRYSAAVDQPSDDDNRPIGETIVEVLRASGLQPEWDGNPRKVVSVQLEWRRRPDSR